MAKWISVKERLPANGDDCVLAIVSGKPREHPELVEAYQLAFYTEACGWLIEEYPAWEDAHVTFWMSLPEPPKEENYEVEMQVHDRI